MWNELILVVTTGTGYIPEELSCSHRRGYIACLPESTRDTVRDIGGPGLSDLAAQRHEARWGDGQEHKRKNQTTTLEFVWRAIGREKGGGATQWCETFLSAVSALHDQRSQTTAIKAPRETPGVAPVSTRPGRCGPPSHPALYQRTGTD